MVSMHGNTRFVRRPSSLESARLGFTRLELVLVLSVILLNVAIFLPFVQRARESARRTQCDQNLKLIGLGLHTYYDVHNSFPAGFEVNPDGNYLGWGWHSRILPHIGAEELYSRIQPHLAEGIYGLPDSPEMKQPMPAFICPSETGTVTVPHARVVTEEVADGIVSEGAEDWNDRLPRSNYFGNVGYLQLSAGGIQYNSAAVPTSAVPLTNAGSLGHFGTNPSPDHRYCDQEIYRGYFGQNSHVHLRQVVDGTSNTLLIGERYAPASSSTRAVGHGSWIGVPDSTHAQGLAMALADASVRINIGMPRREQMTGFGSQHDGGSIFTLGDGSTRFVSQRIDTELFRNLSVIDDSVWHNDGYGRKH